MGKEVTYSQRQLVNEHINEDQFHYCLSSMLQHCLSHSAIIGNA